MTELENQLLFDAHLRPHRSLGRAGFMIFMLLLVAISCTVGLIFLSVGAWPVLGFLGLDVLAVYGAFRWSYRKAKMYETIKLSKRHLEVRRVQPSGKWEQWDFSPYWVRFEFDNKNEENPQLVLSERQARVSVGTFLPNSERLDFGHAFQNALTHVKQKTGM